MLHFLQALPSEAGLGIVVLLSGLLAVLWARLRPPTLVWILALGTPFILARSLYWLPVWLGSHDADQYGAWELLDVVPWYIAGAITSSVVGLLIMRVGKSRTSG